MSEETHCDHCRKHIPNNDTGAACCEVLGLSEKEALFFDLCKHCKELLWKKLDKFIKTGFRVREDE